MLEVINMPCGHFGYELVDGDPEHAKARHVFV